MIFLTVIIGIYALGVVILSAVGRNERDEGGEIAVFWPLILAGLIVAAPFFLLVKLGQWIGSKV